MVAKEKDLDTVLQDMYNFVRKVGIPLCTYPMRIYLWIDTNQETCAPITGYLDLCGTVNEKTLLSIIRGIDKSAPIFQISLNERVFSVVKTIKFMNKKCEVC